MHESVSAEEHNDADQFIICLVLSIAKRQSVAKCDW
jgi:hypothetical protein